MILSRHRKLELHRRISEGPLSTRVMPACIVLRYAGLALLVCRRTLAVTMPGKPTEADYLTGLVREHALEALDG